MLKSRRIFPPGGWAFFQPQTGWNARPGATFEETVRELIKHRSANPRFNLSTDFDEVAAELDQYTCLRLGNNPEYCASALGEDLSKKAESPLPWRTAAAGLEAGVAAVKKVGAGVGALLDWLGEGGNPVDSKLAEHRAGVCAVCPLNQQADLTSFFTAPASNLIRKQIEIRKGLRLETTHDEKLGVCGACACPLRLMVHAPLAHKLRHMTPAALSRLDPACWVLSEKAPYPQPV